MNLLVSEYFVLGAGDEIPGMRVGGCPRLRIPALVSVVNDVFSRALPSGSFIIIGVDVVLLAHNDSSEKRHVVTILVVITWRDYILSGRRNATC
jgi:hypothetical protein